MASGDPTSGPKKFQYFYFYGESCLHFGSESVDYVLLAFHGDYNVGDTMPVAAAAGLVGV